MATKKPSRLTRRAALAAAGAGAATALGALFTPAQATTYRPTVRRTPYNGYYSHRYGRRAASSSVTTTVAPTATTTITAAKNTKPNKHILEDGTTLT